MNRFKKEPFLLPFGEERRGFSFSEFHFLSKASNSFEAYFQLSSRVSETIC